MEHRGNKTIETERLLLRQFHENDAEATLRQADWSNKGIVDACMICYF